MEAAFPGREIVSLENEDQFASEIGEIEYLLALSPPPDYWPQAKKLKLVHSIGAGIDHMWPLKGLPEGVIIANASGLVAEPMSEFGLALILIVRKRIDRAISQQRTRTWKRYSPLNVEGSTLGILGLGQIGAALARRAAQMGMRVIGTQRTPKTVEHVDKIYPPDQTIEVAAQSDVLISLLPWTPDTHGLIDETVIRAMKPGSALVNMGRGGIIDEAAMCRALEDGHLSGAALDVMEQEPLPEDSPLWHAPNLVMTPHIAGVFPTYMEEIALFFAANVERIEAGQPVPTEIPRDRGY